MTDTVSSMADIWSPYMSPAHHGHASQLSRGVDRPWRIACWRHRDDTSISLHTVSSLFISLLASLVFPLVSLLFHEFGHSVPDLHPDRGIAPLCSTYHLHIHTAALAYCRLLVCLLVSFAQCLLPPRLVLVSMVLGLLLRFHPGW